MEQSLMCRLREDVISVLNKYDLAYTESSLEQMLERWSLQQGALTAAPKWPSKLGQ